MRCKKREGKGKASRSASRQTSVIYYCRYPCKMAYFLEHVLILWMSYKLRYYSLNSSQTWTLCIFVIYSYIHNITCGKVVVGWISLGRIYSTTMTNIKTNIN